MAVFEKDGRAAASSLPNADGGLEGFKMLRGAEIAKVKAGIYPAILAMIQREDRIYPEGTSPEQMVRDFRKELAFAEEYDLGGISPEEYTLRQAAEDVEQDGFYFWQDADDEAIRLMNREQLASIIAGKVAEFLVKAEVSDFHLNELIVSGLLPVRPANAQDGGPLGEFENKRAA
jgi:hypothetical protein